MRGEAAALRDRAAAYWAERSPRERRLLLALGVVAAVALVLLLIVRPLQEARAEALADIRTHETLAARLRAAGTDLGRAGVSRTGPLDGIVTASAAQFGLVVQRLEPEGAGVRVALEGVGYDATLRWLADLERTSATRLVEARFDRGTAPGLVSADILLEPR